MPINCPYHDRCSGCPWIDIPYSNQLDRKQERLRNLWQQAGLPTTDLDCLNMISAGEGGLRDRADMTLHREEGKTHLGLYDTTRKTIVDLEVCPQMSPALAAWFQRFRQLIPHIQFGHLRLRVAPDGTRGIWLDFPNHLIEELLHDGVWLRQLAQEARVELSQRRNSLIIDANGLSLGDPLPYPWFETYLKDQALPLHCTIGGFTQPGFRVNQRLVAAVMKEVASCQAGHWLELGSGIGNFTLPLAASGTSVTALENDPRAMNGLLESARQHGLHTHITGRIANIHDPNARLSQYLQDTQAILADPPRSGLRSFTLHLDNQQPNRRPHHFLYISCFDASLVTDVAALYRLGYRLKTITGLDQFPQSKHCEWVVRLMR